MYRPRAGRTMVGMVTDTVVVIVAYLVGTLPTALLVGRHAGHDPTREGSGNPGASNTYRVAGARAGATVLLVDLAKGAVATGGGLLLGGRGLAVACGAAAVLGHCLPVQRRLRGGRGVATALGVATVAWPLVAIALGALWLAVAKAAGKASLASLLAAASLPVGVAVVGRPGWEVAAAAGLAAFVVLRHLPNIVRLARGEEASLRVGGS